MTLGIRAVRDKGNPEKERIVLAADSTEDIGQYILISTTYQSDNSVSSRMRQTLWLPDQKVSAGDLVVIYTKKSKKSITFKTNEDGTKTTFVYWGLDGSVWDIDAACAVLIRIDEWSWKKV